MHAEGSGAFGTYTVTHDVTSDTKAKLFSEVDKKTVAKAIGIALADVDAQA